MQFNPIRLIKYHIAYRSLSKSLTEMYRNKCSKQQEIRKIKNGNESQINLRKESYHGQSSL